jgi:hypothetical protein
MEAEEDKKTQPEAQKAATSADTDAYYGEDDMNMEDLDLSFLDEEDEE